MRVAMLKSLCSVLAVRVSVVVVCYYGIGPAYAALAAMWFSCLYASELSHELAGLIIADYELVMLLQLAAGFGLLRAWCLTLGEPVGSSLKACMVAFSAVWMLMHLRDWQPTRDLAAMVLIAHRRRRDMFAAARGL